jgi:glycine cleavage system H protein
MYPKDYLYNKEHEWIRLEEDVCVLGITSFAQAELGEVVYVDLPEVGESYALGDEIGSIESVKAVAEVFTPIGGEVLAVNQTLEDTPELVNDDPHGKGWLLRLRVGSADELKSLMSAEQYEAFLAE